MQADFTLSLFEFMITMLQDCIEIVEHIAKKEIFPTLMNYLLQILKFTKEKAIKSETSEAVVAKNKELLYFIFQVE